MIKTLKGMLVGRKGYAKHFKVSVEVEGWGTWPLEDTECACTLVQKV